MTESSAMKTIRNLPVPLLPTMVGAITLSNVYQGLGYEWIRHIMMCLGALVWILYVVKLITNFQTCKKEYETTVPSSLYAGFTMIAMLLSSYLFPWFPGAAKGIWLAAIAVHAVHIAVFLWTHVIRNFNWDVFVPSWFVTCNGIMVSTVIGGVMKEPLISKIIVYYGIAIYVILIPFMIYRLMTKELKEAFVHTQAIVLAPCSLCLVSYLNMIENPSRFLVIFLYLCVLLSLLFILVKLPEFFSYSFTPAFAGLTFPMAIGIVASTKMAAWLGAQGMERLSAAVVQLAGIQIYITTAIVGFVLFNFAKLLLKK